MSWRLKWLGSLPVLLALLLQTLSATEILALRDPTADARWPARTSITASSGPLPYTRGSWKQCARLSIGNPGGMVAGRWHGSLSVRSGSVVEADIKGAECIVSDASGKVELIQTDENAIEPGDEAAVSFCVSYSKSWEATADIWFEPAQTDNGLFVQVENDGSSGETTRVLMRRQTGNTMFMSDWSSGQVGSKRGAFLLARKWQNHNETHAPAPTFYSANVCQLGLQLYPMFATLGPLRP